MPLWLWFLIVANMSITEMSLSLMLNSVEFYQATDLPKIVQAGYNLIPYFIFNPQEGKTKVILRAGQMVELDGRRSEVLGNVARMIQQQKCTYIARKEFIS
ncbi:hypothetical protein GIB67_010094 [Kingdonia uniflora]|uniref:Uncharacterized protein n=1 Tax=Kingdonia uniflora TaxID=39325 RepID=A0A7J7PAL1_9MAGN|nr:hypothetical protein GIB67_010094 [Kingdonia uniflora]